MNKLNLTLFVVPPAPPAERQEHGYVAWARDLMTAEQMDALCVAKGTSATETDGTKSAKVLVFLREEVTGTPERLDGAMDTLKQFAPMLAMSDVKAAIKLVDAAGELRTLL